MTKIDKIIEDLLEMNGGEENKAISLLREIKDKVPEDASDEDILTIIEEHLRKGIASTIDEPDIGLSDKDKEIKDNAVSTVKEFMDENHWRYRVEDIREDLTVFDLGFITKGVTLRAKVFVEANPLVCRINASLPITCDPKFALPVAKVLNDVNFPRRFGCMKLDSRDGEISYEHSFLIRSGLHKPDLKTYFHAVINSATIDFDKIRRYCVGKFKNPEVDELINNISELVDEINE